MLSSFSLRSVVCMKIKHIDRNMYVYPSKGRVPTGARRTVVASVMLHLLVFLTWLVRTVDAVQLHVNPLRPGPTHHVQGPGRTTCTCKLPVDVWDAQRVATGPTAVAGERTYMCVLSVRNKRSPYLPWRQRCRSVNTPDSTNTQPRAQPHR